ncbi:hypothetical protein BaRGS_00008663 [Batillaria attramentaria]|uniref:Uncharacterized protein n=1 Tax=Batillaria attramentaria TaxID=370345 RepID=A0ABD0LLJ1_9CAEN
MSMAPSIDKKKKACMFSRLQKSLSSIKGKNCIGRHAAFCLPSRIARLAQYLQVVDNQAKRHYPNQQDQLRIGQFFQRHNGKIEPLVLFADKNSAHVHNSHSSGDVWKERRHIYPPSEAFF